MYQITLDLLINCGYKFSWFFKLPITCLVILTNNYLDLPKMTEIGCKVFKKITRCYKQLSIGIQ